ncbi:MAG: c-type cytochrome, partial [Candidatus Rokuibacteriota bacterium]
GCGPDERAAATARAPASLVRADAARGHAALQRYGCGACHVIPGVAGARGIVGPSLANLSARPYLAGSLVNEPGNLVAWIRDPRGLQPRTVMPVLGVTEADARDIAAFLYGTAR